MATKVARGRRLPWIGKTNGHSYQETELSWGLSKKISLVLSTRGNFESRNITSFPYGWKNQSSASAKGDSDRFKLMFLDRTIFKGYQQSNSKVQYVIKYGIADHLKKQLIYDVKNTSYSFCFDETTNFQVKKQYDGYVIYWSKRSDSIVYS